VVVIAPNNTAKRFAGRSRFPSLIGIGEIAVGAMLFFATLWLDEFPAGAVLVALGVVMVLLGCFRIARTLAERGDIEFR
jgi:hypothetical protein